MSHHDGDLSVILLANTSCAGQLSVRVEVQSGMVLCYLQKRKDQFTISYDALATSSWVDISGNLRIPGVHRRQVSPWFFPTGLNATWVLWNARHFTKSQSFWVVLKSKFSSHLYKEQCFRKILFANKQLCLFSKKTMWKTCEWPRKIRCQCPFIFFGK